MDNLFYDVDNNAYCAKDIKNILIDIGASECETLFVHSDVFFGRPAEGFKRRQYLQTLFETISEIGVENLIFPTFTYSFCNDEVYDIENSRTTMGAFNEFVRKKENRYRTEDPLLSVSVPSSLISKFQNISNHSLGKGSALDILHGMDNVKFLFFGAEMAECFTYVHYVEKMLDVPYRFDQSFKGNIIYPNGEKKERQQIIHTQCTGAVLPSKYVYFEEEMEEKGLLKKKRLANKYVSCIDERLVFEEIKEHINNNINYFLAKPIEESRLVQKYTFTNENGKITHC